jgi:hypothetical protein
MANGTNGNSAQESLTFVFILHVEHLIASMMPLAGENSSCVVTS